MDKVLVDRELLEQIVNTNMGDYALIALQHKEILAILAQPADAEVVQRYCFDQTGCDVADNEGPWVSYDDHIAALSAVTAERDRLDELSEALGRQIADAGQREIAYRAEVEAMRKDAGRYRWLRDKSESLHGFYLSTPIWMTGVRFRPENVDSTIDAAMAAKESVNDKHD